jgi:hypothetical protein
MNPRLDPQMVSQLYAAPAPPARPILRHDLRPVFKNDERARRVRGFRSRLGFAVIDGLWGRRRCSEARLPRAALRFAPRDARCTGVRSYAQQ